MSLWEKSNCASNPEAAVEEGSLEDVTLGIHRVEQRVKRPGQCP